MPSAAFGNLMKKMGAERKLRFDNDDDGNPIPKTLVFEKVEEIKTTDPTGKEKDAARITVWDVAAKCKKVWITQSVAVFDALFEIEPRTIFTAVPTKRGAKKGWKIELKGMAKGDE